MEFLASFLPSIVEEEIPGDRKQCWDAQHLKTNLICGDETQHFKYCSLLVFLHSYTTKTTLDSLGFSFCHVKTVGILYLNLIHFIKMFEGLIIFLTFSATMLSLRNIPIFTNCTKVKHKTVWFNTLKEGQGPKNSIVAISKCFWLMLLLCQLFPPDCLQNTLFCSSLGKNGFTTRNVLKLNW